MTGGGRYSDVRRALREVRRDTALSGRGAGGRGAAGKGGRYKRRGRTAAAAAVVAAAAAVSAAVAGRAIRLSHPRRAASLSLSHHRYPPPASTRSFRLSLSPPTGGGGESRACAVPARRDDQGGEGKITTAYPPPTAACSPARLFARSLPRSLPRFASPRLASKAQLEKVRPPARLHYLPASPSCLVRAPREPYALRDPRECPCEGWREARARSRTGVPITRKHASPPRFSRASFKRLTFHPVTLFLAIGVRRGKGFRVEFLWMVIHAYICMYVYFCWSKSRRSLLRGM